MAGTVGAIFNCALQLGSAIGLAASSSIETSVEATHGGFFQYYGRAAVFYFIMGVVGLQTVGVLVFYRVAPTSETADAKTVQGSVSTEVICNEQCAEVQGKDVIC